MPVMRGKDKEGRYYQWGEHGTKYHYTSGDPLERELAKARAIRQGRAISIKKRGK